MPATCPTTSRCFHCVKRRGVTCLADPKPGGASALAAGLPVAVCYSFEGALGAVTAVETRDGRFKSAVADG